MNSNLGLPNKKTNKINISKHSISKSTLNPKKITKKKEEAKSTNIEMFQKKNDINNIIDYNINNDGEIKLQEKQKRDHSKKAKKAFVNKNIGKNNIDNIGANINFGNDYVDKVEKVLKTKVQSINPEISKSKNFLKSSINEYDLFQFNNILTGYTDTFFDKNDNELKPKTNLPKKMATNTFLNKREEIKGKNNNNIIMNQQNLQKPYFLKESNNNNISNKNNNQEKKNNYITNLDKKKYINDSENFEENGLNKKAIINKNKRILVPMTNFTKENNCFLNTLIQALSNLDEFRDYLLQNSFKNTKSDVVKELCDLINSYKNMQEKYINNNNQIIEPTLSVNNLRKDLNNIYGDYFKGECGDPMETLEHLLNLIHKDSFIENISFNKETEEICKCPSHNYFFLNIKEIKYCKKCYKTETKAYDKNCYMFDIFSNEIVNNLQINSNDFNKYKSNLFYKIKVENEKYENNTRIQKCKCTELNYAKKLKFTNSNNNPYLIINITWAEEFPNMVEILNIFTLLPITDKYHNLFSMEKKDININKKLYIKAIILYGIYHYVFVIYLNDQKKWGIVDDKIIKYIDKYYDLIEYLLKNHLMPVGLFYSLSLNDKIEKDDIFLNLITNDEYLRLYKFCEDVEKRRKETITNIVKSKGSFNETNQDYLDNNLFYNSILDLVNYSSDSDYEECKKKIEEQKSEKKDENNEDEKQDANDNIKNKKSKDKNSNSLKGEPFMGDFNNNVNLKGELIMFSNSYGENENNKNINKNYFDNKIK